MKNIVKEKLEEERKMKEARAVAEEVYQLKGILSFMKDRDIKEIIVRDRNGEQRNIKARENYTKTLMMMLYQRLHYLGKRFDELVPPENDD